MQIEEEKTPAMVDVTGKSLFRKVQQLRPTCVLKNEITEKCVSYTEQF